MGALTQRRDSEYEGEDPNVNVTWVSSPFAWAFYVTLIAGFRWALAYFVPATVCSWEMGWTVTNVLHAVVSCACELTGLCWGNLLVFLVASSAFPTPRRCVHRTRRTLYWKLLQ